MEAVNRRSFLIKGSVGAVGAAGVVAGGLKLSQAGDEPEAGLSSGELSELPGPVLLSVRDAATGEVEVLVDEREVVFTDRALVAKVLRAAR